MIPDHFCFEHEVEFTRQQKHPRGLLFPPPGVGGVRLAPGESVTLDKYPDYGGRYDDPHILRNAIEFTTAQRAYRAHQIIFSIQLEQINPFERALLAVEGFQNYVVTLEDVQGWLYVFKEWTPGRVDKSLLALLDTVEVGGRGWSESEALALLRSIDCDGYRRLVHVPTSEELRALDWSEEMIEVVAKSMAAQHRDLPRSIELRDENDRNLVKGYNKAKHMLLGLLIPEPDEKYIVGLYTAKGHGIKAYQGDRIELEGAELLCEPEDSLAKMLQSSSRTLG